MPPVVTVTDAKLLDERVRPARGWQRPAQNRPAGRPGLHYSKLKRGPGIPERSSYVSLCIWHATRYLYVPPRIILRQSTAAPGSARYHAGTPLSASPSSNRFRRFEQLALFSTTSRKNLHNAHVHVSAFRRASRPEARIVPGVPRSALACTTTPACRHRNST